MRYHRKAIAILLAAVWLLAGCGAASDGFPPRLGGRVLARVIEGREAAAAIDRLHGKKLDDCDNYIVYYGGRQAQNILFASVYADEATANRNLMAMTARMARGVGPFAPLSVEKPGDGIYFATEGMGLKHWFFRRARVLLWLQVEPAGAAAAFEDLRRFDFSRLEQKGA